MALGTTDSQNVVVLSKIEWSLSTGPLLISHTSETWFSRLYRGFRLSTCSCKNLKLSVTLTFHWNGRLSLVERQKHLLVWVLQWLIGLWTLYPMKMIYNWCTFLFEMSVQSFIELTHQKPGLATICALINFGPLVHEMSRVRMWPVV